MALPLSENTRLRWAVVIALAISLAVVILHLQPVYGVVGEGAYPVIYDLLDIGLNAVGAAFACVTWRSSDKAEPNKIAWGMLALGLLLWTAGAVVRVIYELILNLTLFYPSVADAAWALGNVALLFGLLKAHSASPYLAISLPRRLVALVSFLLMVGVFMYVIGQVLDIYNGWDPISSGVMAYWCLFLLVGIAAVAISRQFPGAKPTERLRGVLIVGFMLFLLYKGVISPLLGFPTSGVSLALIFAVLGLTGDLAVGLSALFILQVGGVRRVWRVMGIGFVLIAVSDLLLFHVFAPTLNVSYLIGFILVDIGLYSQASAQRNV